MNDQVNQYDLVDALHMMEDVVDDNHGNVSCRIDDTVWIKPSGMEYGKITVQDLVVSSLDGKIVTSNNGRKPSVDLVNHLAIYRRYPEIGAICHTHSPHVVAFASAGIGIMCGTTEQADRFGGNVLCNEFVEDPDGWGEQVDLLAAGCTSRAALLEYHGGLTFAKDPVTAVQRAGYLEDIARKAYMAAILANTCPVMFTRQVKTWHERYEKKYGQ